MTVNYGLTIDLPIEQVFIKAENFEDCVQDALDEALSEQYLMFDECVSDNLTSDDETEIYNIFNTKGIEYFMKHCKFSMDNLSAIIQGNCIRYIVRIELDITGIMEGE